MRKELALLSVLATSCGDAGGTQRPKNLLVVCIDTLRADQLGAYSSSRSASSRGGAKAALTPNLDALAQESVVFERAHATASWTLPSVASVFTSFFPSTHRCWDFGSRLSEAFDTLPEIFRSAGFDTQGIASHDFFEAKFGLQQGFDAFDAELAHRKGEPGWKEITSPDVSAKAVRWLEERARAASERPWLLFVHFFDPHLPYVDHEATPPAPAADEFAGYRSEVAFTDGYVGSVLDALARAGFADDTAVLFFSDHGESFYEHPGIHRHSYSLYEEELRVPLFLRSPGLAPRRVSASVRTVDLLPTLLELFGLARDIPEEREGVSLFPLCLGREEELPANLAEIRLKDGHHANALVSGRWKLIEDVSNARLSLFDLASDPREARDLALERPELVQELTRLLRAQIAEAEALGRAYPAGQRVEHTPEELEHLRELGYGGEEER